MPVNRGKQFEEAIRKALSDPTISVDRLYDPTAGFAGVKNICDFVVYHYPRQFYFECKSHYGNTLNFESAITDRQWSGLAEKSKIDGVIAGFIVWFIDHDTTVFVPISEMLRLKAEGKKSLNIKDIESSEVKYVPVPGSKKRILFDYYGLLFLNSLIKYF